MRVEAYRDGRQIPRRIENELQASLMASLELAGRLGMVDTHLRSLIYEERWDRVPQPAGKVGRSLYWFRAEVDRWFEEQDENEQA